MIDGHVIFNGVSRLMKLYVKDRGTGVVTLRHTIECHDVGVGDQYVTAGEDLYGAHCKCPPGKYLIGTPMACATRDSDGTVTVHNDDDPAYGCWFTPLDDTEPDEAFAKHGRAGIGIHGGGSDLPAPFALQQGWEYTLGCLRLQNVDNEQIFVPYVRYIKGQGGLVAIDVSWSA
jgi:hypothetical protein